MRIYLLAICPLAVLIASAQGATASAELAMVDSELETAAESVVSADDSQMLAMAEAELPEVVTPAVAEDTPRWSEPLVVHPLPLTAPTKEDLPAPVDIAEPADEDDGTSTNIELMVPLETITAIAETSEVTSAPHQTVSDSEASPEQVPSEADTENNDVQVVFLEANADETVDDDLHWPDNAVPHSVVFEPESQPDQSAPTLSELAPEQPLPPGATDLSQEYPFSQTPLPVEAASEAPADEDNGGSVSGSAETLVLPEQAMPQTIVFEPRSQTVHPLSPLSPEAGTVPSTYPEDKSEPAPMAEGNVETILERTVNVHQFGEPLAWPGQVAPQPVVRSQNVQPIVTEQSSEKTTRWNRIQRFDQLPTVSPFKPKDQLMLPEQAIPQTIVFAPRAQAATQTERSSENLTAEVNIDRLRQAHTVSQAISDDETEADSSDDDFLESPPTVDTIDPADLENELGDIQILEKPTDQPTEQPIGQLVLRSSVFTSSNISGQEDSGVGDVITNNRDNDDIIFANSLFVLSTPEIGPDTRLISSLGGGFVRFGDNGDSNYNFLNLGLAAQHRITPAVYGEFGINWQQLYTERNGERSLSDVSPRLRIGRQDVLGDRLRLDSLYELKVRLTDPKEQQRISNSLGVRLNYEHDPKWRSGLEYRITAEDYTQDTRFDLRNLLRAVTTYNLDEDSFISGSLSYLFGSSSRDSVDIENFSIGISIGFNVPF